MSGLKVGCLIIIFLSMDVQAAHEYMVCAKGRGGLQIKESPSVIITHVKINQVPYCTVQYAYKKEEGKMQRYWGAWECSGAVEMQMFRMASLAYSLKIPVKVYRLLRVSNIEEGKTDNEPTVDDASKMENCVVGFELSVP